MASIKVIVVDDSALIRKLLSDVLNSDPGINVVATAQDPYDAREKIKQYNPDVLTLDVEMPKMDGITFLRNLMNLRPMPVVMVSTLTAQGADTTFQALELGAVDFVTKPKVDVEQELDRYAKEIINKVKMASKANVHEVSSRVIKHDFSARTLSNKLNTTDKIIAIGASTGGTEAIKDMLLQMPSNSPGMVIAQHMPPAFTKPFADRLDRTTQLVVSQAEDGEQILPGHAYVAPGGLHLEIYMDGARYRCRVKDGELVNRFKPSVDVLFDSVAKFAGKNAIGVLLTGMGKDGAKGLKAMQEKGAMTVAQDEASSVVWGMPGAAVNIDAADHILPLMKIPNKVSDQVIKIAV